MIEMLERPRTSRPDDWLQFEIDPRPRGCSSSHWRKILRERRSRNRLTTLTITGYPAHLTVDLPAFTETVIKTICTKLGVELSRRIEPHLKAAIDGCEALRRE